MASRVDTVGLKGREGEREREREREREGGKEEASEEERGSEGIKNTIRSVHI